MVFNVARQRGTASRDCTLGMGMGVTMNLIMFVIPTSCGRASRKEIAHPLTTGPGCPHCVEKRHCGWLSCTCGDVGVAGGIPECDLEYLVVALYSEPPNNFIPLKTGF